MEFCDQSWNLINFAPQLDQICTFFATTKKLSIDIKSPHFPTFSAKCRQYKIEKRIESMEKSWKDIFLSLWEPCDLHLQFCDQC